MADFCRNLCHRDCTLDGTKPKRFVRCLYMTRRARGPGDPSMDPGRAREEHTLPHRRAYLSRLFNATPTYASTYRAKASCRDSFITTPRAAPTGESRRGEGGGPRGRWHFSALFPRGWGVGNFSVFSHFRCLLTGGRNTGVEWKMRLDCSVRIWYSQTCYLLS